MEPQDHVTISIKLPKWKFNWRAWLPSRGNVLFTLLAIMALIGAQNVGAFPSRAPEATSTGTVAYQGRLADSGGAPLTATLGMIFRLYNVASGGSPLWEEQWTGPNSVRVSDGLFNVMLGSLAPIPQSVMTGNNSLWLGITVGADNEMAPRVQLGSVPFAVQALTVPDGSISTAKIQDGAVTQLKAPSLIASMTSSNVKLLHGSYIIPVSGTPTQLSWTVTVAPACANPLKVFIQPDFNWYSDVTAAIGAPLSGSVFSVFLSRSSGAPWGNGQDQSFSWFAICE